MDKDQIIEIYGNSPVSRNKTIWAIFTKMADDICESDGPMGLISLPVQAAAECIHKPDLDALHSARTCAALGLAGWTGWTAADRMRDNGSENQSVDDCVVFSAAMAIMDGLLRSLRLPEACGELFESVIVFMEDANLRESRSSERDISCFDLQSLVKTSIDKSIGAAIPLMAFMIKMGADIEDLVSCISYFQYLISVRQLSDDACDWREDMRARRHTVVTELLRRTAGRRATTRKYAAVFEKQVKFDVATMILDAARQSIAHASKMTCFKSTEFLEKLPRHYEEMASGILMKQAQAKRK
ncbi:MAG: hypothetical protein KGI49_02000 [Patescibacteria group bacterium]|nr:hypothetical protein [Patescibacteria group bacterium]